MGVTGPEADAQAALPLVAPLGQKAGRFQHGGIGPAIVHHAVVPGIVMAGKEHEGHVRTVVRKKLRD